MKKIIIGIDPGTYITGYGILEIDSSFNNNNIKYIYSDCIISNSNFFCVRLNKIYNYILDVFLYFKPLEIVIEKTFLKNNLNTSFKLNQVNAVIILAATVNFIPIYEYNINTIRNKIFCKKRVSKLDINLFVKNIFNIKHEMNYNVTDAIAVAISHIYINYK